MRDVDHLEFLIDDAGQPQVPALAHDAVVSLESEGDQELRRDGLYEKTAQAFVVLLPVRSVGVMGDFRTYENVVALRAVDFDVS